MNKYLIYILIILLTVLTFGAFNNAYENRKELLNQISTYEKVIRHYQEKNCSNNCLDANEIHELKSSLLEKDARRFLWELNKAQNLGFMFIITIFALGSYLRKKRTNAPQTPSQE